MRVRRPTTLRLGLVAKFALVSLVAVTVLGVVLAHFLSAQIRERAFTDTKDAADLLVSSDVQPQLDGYSLDAGLDPRILARLQTTLNTSLAHGAIARVAVWNRRDQIVYSDDMKLVGLRFPPADELDGALAGKHANPELASREDAGDAHLQSSARYVEVYVPLQLTGDARPDGVFEIFLPYEPIAKEIAADGRTMILLLIGGLLLLYASLFPIAAGASRRLRNQAEENEHQALHDPLTDLPNRTLFRERVEEAVRSARPDETIGVVLMDLDRFKEINDTLGHHAGDLLLQEVSERLVGLAGPDDTVARLGGDEFALVLRDVTRASLARFARRVHGELERPVQIDELVVDAEGSLGVALWPDHGAEVETLIQRADVAMYSAKSSHTRFAIYDPAGDQHRPERLALVGEMRRAISEGELVVFYQPKADVGTGEVKSVEALVRWQHPQRGLLPPLEFMPLVERTGLIKPLTFYVLDVALGQCAAWRRDGIDLAVAVNLSMRSLHDLELTQEVAHLLEKWQVDPARLQLEITEDSIMADPVRARETLLELSSMGVGLSIDDFGTGYSSLAYLRSLPMNEIKIDRSFVMHMDKDDNDAVIVRSTIDLGRNLGLDVVAEGVESAAIWNQLDALGCDLLQGFYLSRPVPASDLTAWLVERSREAQRLAS